MQVEHTVTTASIEQIKEKVRDRVWRKSHSLNSVKTFNNAVKKFEKYLENKQLTYEDVIKAAVQHLDDFSAWLDKRYSGSTTNTYVQYTKKLLKPLGAEIDEDDFKENVTLPKKKTFMDDKVNEDQIRRIVLACKNEKLKNLLMLMKDMPARPVEVIGLKLGDFNLAYDPPFLTIPPHLAKNDIPREAFFTPETKRVLISYIENRGIKNSEDFLFLDGIVDELDEVAFQHKLLVTEIDLASAFRTMLSRPEFSDMNELVKQQGTQKRYKIHIYSFKKFSFTRIADTLGEIAARAIKGDKAYIMTYYKKSREERAEDYRKMIPKLSVFVPDDQVKIRDQVEEAIKTLKKEDLGRLLEFIKNGNNLPRK